MSARHKGATPSFQRAGPSYRSTMAVCASDRPPNWKWSHSPRMANIESELKLLMIRGYPTRWSALPRTELSFVWNSACPSGREGMLLTEGIDGLDLRCALCCAAGPCILARGKEGAKYRLRMLVKLPWAATRSQPEIPRMDAGVAANASAQSMKRQWPWLECVNLRGWKWLAEFLADWLCSRRRQSMVCGAGANRLILAKGSSPVRSVREIS